MTGYTDELGQLRMQKRFSHQMKIQKPDMIFQTIGQKFKFIQGHEFPGSLRFRTELAIQIAHIRYFKIASGDHYFFFSAKIGK